MIFKEILFRMKKESLLSDLNDEVVNKKITSDTSENEVIELDSLAVEKYAVSFIFFG